MVTLRFHFYRIPCPAIMIYICKQTHNMCYFNIKRKCSKDNLRRSISSMWSQVERGIEIQVAWRKYKLGECQFLHKGRNMNKMLLVVFAFIADAYLPRNYKVSWRRKNVICNSSPVKTGLQPSVNEFKLKSNLYHLPMCFIPITSGLVLILTWIVHWYIIYIQTSDWWDVQLAFICIEMIKWWGNVWPMVACPFWALVVLYRMLSIFT